MENEVRVESVDVQVNETLFSDSEVVPSGY